jgi:predicted nucleic acid-binding protein
VAAVISDSGPLIHLAQIGKLQLLKDLFGCVYISTSVKVEVVYQGIQRNRLDADIVELALKEGWLKTQPLPKRLQSTAQKLVKGENISLADAEIVLIAEEKKGLFLTDDIPLAKLAIMYGLRAWDTWTLLLESQSKNMIGLNDVESAIEELGKQKFKLNPKQTKEILITAKVIEQRKHKVDSTENPLRLGHNKQTKKT